MFLLRSLFQLVEGFSSAKVANVQTADPRARLVELAAARGDSLVALSTMLGRNVAYLGQWVRLGTPRLLGERDRRALADYFGVPEAALGGPAERAEWRVPRLDVAASAGPGAVGGDDVLGAEVIAPELARSLRLTPGHAAIIRVTGDSMAPGLIDGDQLVVDEASRAPDARGGIYVIRIDGLLLVKRVARRLGALSVWSDNPDAPPVPAGEVELIGRVAWQMRVPR